MVTNYPNRVFIANIHAGGYAAPDPGQVELRTADGELINDSSFVGASGQSYPSGNVNRSTAPWASGRDTWTAKAQTIMAQTSPVNVAVRSSVNMATRECTTEVEIYYTSASESSTNKLSVMLLQDNIIGDQVGASKNPANQVGDLYRHNHVFRMMISEGALGEKISPTSAGTFISKKFVTKIPYVIGNVPVNMFNLKVIAFVSQSSANIYSGSGCDVDYGSAKKTDIKIENATTFPADYCFTSINPKLKVTNLDQSNNITSFDVTVNIGGTDHTKSFTGNLAYNESTVIDWGNIDYTASGSFNFDFFGASNINANDIFDSELENNVGMFTGFGFTKNAFTTFDAGFEDGTVPANMAFDYSENSAFTLLFYGSQYKFGALNTTHTILFYLHESWQLANKPGNILFGEASITGMAQPFLRYFYAYSDGSQGGTAPTVRVQVSEDCGDTWTTIDTKTLTETGQPSSTSSLYFPSTSHYKVVNVNLDAYKDKNILIKLSGIPGTSGNAMYIDQISIGSGALGNDGNPTGVEEETVAGELTLYPNPADFEVRFNGENYLGQSFSIYTLLGEQVAFGVNNDNRIDVASLSAGTYIIKINNETLRFIKK